jgi:glycosyltransferase involved in cell wall biosynthesis
LRLAVVSPFVDRRHGTERALAELLEKLALEYGCEIHLYAQRVDDLPLDDGRLAREAKSGAIIWHKVPSIPGPQLSKFIGWIFLNGFLRRSHVLFGGAPFDVVLSPGINCLHPNVVIVHALFHRLQELAKEEKEESALRGSFVRRLHRRLYYGLLAALERRIYADERVNLAAVSPRTAGHLKKYFHREIVCVIPNAVDSAYFTRIARLARREEGRRCRGLRNEEFVLLLIGNDWRVKGLPTILEAMALLPGRPLRLLVVGNDAAAPFHAYARKLGLEKRCLWELPQPDVIDFYAVADAYVSPSREDSFGLPVAEAMACGLPVVTSTFAGVADYIHHDVDGFISRDPDDAQALADLIERLRTDEALRHAIGEAAAKTILEWTWERNAAAVWQLLKDAKSKAHREQ